MSKAIFAGYPIMDVLNPTGKDLQLEPNLPMIALLPGSRLPEALHNLTLQLQVSAAIAKICPMQFRCALVPMITEEHLQELAVRQQWEYQGQGRLRKDRLVVQFYRDAFPEILHQCNLAIGMAGTAVEQAVGLGKPVVQIPGNGPQFTYPFAEAQMRLLGISVKTIGKKTADPAIIKQAAREVVAILEDAVYLKSCQENGRIRVGEKGGSLEIVQEIIKCI
jgi:uncharacterized protein (TIGR03492 family)